MHVEFDDTRGEVRAAGVRAPLAAAGEPGTVQVGGPGGPVLRPVTFAERSAAAAAALAAADPVGALCAGLRTCATVRAGELRARMLDLVVLALAGAETEDAPSFAATAAAVVRATGARLDSVLAAPAREVDRLAGPAAAAADDGWTRVTFDRPAAPGDLREDLARRLLRRAAPEALAAGETARGTPAALDHAAGPLPPENPGRLRPRDESASRVAPSRIAAGDLVAAAGDARVEAPAERAASMAAHDTEAAAGDPVIAPAGATAHELAGAAAHDLVGDAVAGVAANDRAGSVASDEFGSLGPAAANALGAAWPAEHAPGIAAAHAAVLDGRRATSRLLAPVRDPAPASSVSARAAAPRLATRRVWHAAGAPGPIGHDAAPRGRDDRVELDVADALARALHDEADLRGLAR